MTRRVLITGAGGFLGFALASQLVQEGREVHGFSHRSYPQLSALGVHQHQGELADPTAVADAVAGCEAVFHVAARPGAWGAYRDYYQTNFVGTENVIAACRQHQVRDLIYTSTPSVIGRGEDLEGVDESLDYPKSFRAAYPETKAMAERLVRDAHGDDLRTVSLRPHLIWGPGDTSLLPRIVDRAKAGKLRRIEAKGAQAEKLIDTTYIDDAVQAHLRAAAALAANDDAVMGKVYFISSGQPIGTWTMINRMLAAAGMPPITRRMSPPLAKFIGATCEGIYGLVRAKAEPPLTRWVADELATAHWFDISAARRDLGYVPTIDMDEGMRRLAAWWATRQDDPCSPKR